LNSQSESNGCQDSQQHRAVIVEANRKRMAKSRGDDPLIWKSTIIPSIFL